MGMLGEQGRGLKFKWKRIYTALAPQELNLNPCTMEAKGCFHFEVIINGLVSSFRLYFDYIYNDVEIYDFRLKKPFGLHGL